MLLKINLFFFNVSDLIIIQAHVSTRVPNNKIIVYI